MKNYIAPGEVITVTAPANVVGGQLVRVGQIVGVAAFTAASGQPVELAVEGVFELSKTSAQAWTEGAALYMIPASGLVTTATTSGNLFIGVAAAAAANPSATGLVRLNGSMPATALP